MTSNDGSVSRKEQRDERPIPHRSQHCSGTAPQHLQSRSQSHWLAILLPVARGCFGWRCTFCIDALPPGLARRCTSLLRLHQARAILGDADDAWHVDDLLCADHSPAGRFWKLFSAASDRRERDGVPATQYALVLVYAPRVPNSALGIFCE